MLLFWQTLQTGKELSVPFSSLHLSWTVRYSSIKVIKFRKLCRERDQNDEVEDEKEIKFKFWIAEDCSLCSWKSFSSRFFFVDYFPRAHSRGDRRAGKFSFYKLFRVFFFRVWLNFPFEPLSQNCNWVFLRMNIIVFQSIWVGQNTYIKRHVRVSSSSSFFCEQRMKSLKFHFHSNIVVDEYEGQSFLFIGEFHTRHTSEKVSFLNVYNENQINLNFIIYVNMKSFANLMLREWWREKSFN